MNYADLKWVEMIGKYERKYCYCFQYWEAVDDKGATYFKRTVRKWYKPIYWVGQKLKIGKVYGWWYWFVRRNITLD